MSIKDKSLDCGEKSDKHSMASRTVRHQNGLIISAATGDAAHGHS